VIGGCAITGWRTTAKAEAITMELLYNPDRMPEEEIKATFVAREALVDELVALVEGQPDGAGVQHAVIIAPRGMGKTTVLLMVKFAIKDRGLADRWQAVKFPEESYGIYDLADFWIETLNLIAADTADAELRQLADDLKTKYPNNDELQEAAYATIKDWRRKHGKRLLLLAENFDQILGQINDERDNARLRDALMNDGAVMILGGATTFFKEARAYDQPLYNFFKIYDLADLKFAQMQELLRRRAQTDGIANFKTKLEQNASRLRALEYFTGGNPRLVLMLYRVVSHSDVTEVRRALEKLLDEVTPYYKAKVETLPPQQRKILDHIARVSGRTSEGLTPTEIAEAVRLSPNQVSAQLKRLMELGYVRTDNLRKRSSYYMLSEPLYAIWHQMRFGRTPHQRMLFLINFLKVWYTAEQIGEESKRLSTRFQERLVAAEWDGARDTLEYLRYLAEAMNDTPERMVSLESLIRRHFELLIAETGTDELLARIKREDLTDETLNQLSKALRLSAVSLSPIVGYRGKVALRDREVVGDQEKVALYDREVEKVLRQTERQLIKQIGHFFWNLRGMALVAQGHYQDAIASFDRALVIMPGFQEALYNRGRVYLKKFIDLVKQGQFDKAKQDWDEAMDSVRQANNKNWTNILSEALLVVAQMGHLGFARKLIAESELEEQLFSLALALDLIDLVKRKWFDQAKQDWNEWQKAVRNSDDKDWENATSEVLLKIAQVGHLSLARELITESKLEELLFPLARAIDYLQSGDRALIEKLSPEVRGIVEEVVAKLKTVSGGQKPDDQSAQ
jgi:DNA-binding transcriptional ArsR family regulator